MARAGSVRGLERNVFRATTPTSRFDFATNMANCFATNMANCCITYCATAGHRRPFCALRHNAEAYHGFAKHPNWSQPRSRFPTSFRTPRRQQERSGNRSSRVVPWGFGGTMATLSQYIWCTGPTNVIYEHLLVARCG